MPIAHAALQGCGRAVAGLRAVFTVLVGPLRALRSLPASQTAAPGDLESALLPNRVGRGARHPQLVRDRLATLQGRARDAGSCNNLPPPPPAAAAAAASRAPSLRRVAEQPPAPRF